MKTPRGGVEAAEAVTCFVITVDADKDAVTCRRLGKSMLGVGIGVNSYIDGKN